MTDREFWLEVRRAALILVKAVDKRHGVPGSSRGPFKYERFQHASPIPPRNVRDHLLEHRRVVVVQLVNHG